MPRIAIEGQDHWHRLRAANVGASDVAALFDESPYKSRWQLWMEKAGRLAVEDIGGKEQVFWGNVLEPAVAQGAAEQYEWTVRKIRTYWTHPRIDGFGASLDYEIVNHPDGPGVMEVKTVDGMAYRSWPDGEPPLSYLLQVQHQLAVTGRKWGAIPALIGGNRLKVFTWERHEPTIQRLEEAVAAFWQSIRDGQEPTPDFERDAKAIGRAYRDAVKGREIDLTGDNDVMALVTVLETARERAGQWSKAADAAKAELLYRVGDAATAILPDGRTVDAPTRTRKESTVVMPATSYRDVRIKAPKDDSKQKAA